jgi:hypothetical protein
MSSILNAAYIVHRISAERTHVGETQHGRHPAGASGGDPAASRRANPPGAGARGGLGRSAKGGGWCDRVLYFRRRRRFGVGGSFGMHEEQQL